MGQGNHVNTRRRLAMLAALPLACLALTAPANAAQIEVTTTADNLVADGNCSLREAIDAAVDNAANGSGCTAGEPTRDTIVLAAGANYALTLPTNNDFGNQNGDLDIGAGGPVTIRGDRQEPPSITTNQGDRIIQLTATNSDVTVAHVRLAGGSVTGLGDDGGLVFVENGGLTVRHAELTDGAARDGGAIHVGPAASLNLTDSTVSKNAATRGGGGINLDSDAAPSRIADTAIRDNTVEAAAAGDQVRGGGLLHLGQELVIERSVIRDNLVANTANAPNSHGLGGGLAIGQNATITGSTIAGNEASAVHADARSDGGGIAITGTPISTSIQIINSTLAGNTARRGGAIGGLSQQGSLALAHLTLAGNTAVDATGADHIDTTGSGGFSLTLKGLLIANSNETKACMLSPGTQVVSTGYNVASAADPDCEFGDLDHVGGDVDLRLVSGTATDNGGPVPTIAIRPKSDARHVVPAGECAATDGTDARGVERLTTDPGSEACDAGAYEFMRCAGKVIGANTILGTPGADTLKGTSGSDVIFAQGGNDKITAKGGKDRVCGGNGKDRIKGAGGKDLLRGEAGNDRIAGGAGNDRLLGGPGRDTLLGGPGKDKLNGGPGKDKEKQ